ncbi:MAG: TonB-dependent receptor [Opitutaceae bacterium]|jgi:hypothetical protein
MQKTTPHLICVAGVLTATLVAAPQLSAADAKNSDAFPVFDSYIKVSGQAASITGNGAAYQANTGQSQQNGAGIEEFHYSKELPKDNTLTMDGRALSGSEDYLLRVNLAKADLGTIDVGYSRFRTFYDGVGGFFPLNSAWHPLNPQDLFVDRGKFWAEAKFAREDRPEFTIRYTNETRDGQKDSTEWGDSTVTGIPGPGTTDRHVIPAYLQLNERHQELRGTMKHTVGNTSFQVTVLGDWVNNIDQRFATLYPGEVGKESNVTTTDGVDTFTMGVMGTATTELSPLFTLRTGLRYQDVDNNFTGDRPKVSGTGVTTYDYFDLTGEATARITTGSIALDFKPTQDFTATFGLRGEHRKTESTATYNTGTPATPTARYEYSHIDEDALTPELGLRYTGIRDLALYASASKRIVDGTEDHTSPYTSGALPATYLFSTTPTEDHADYKVGANWRQSSFLTLRGEVFYKDHENKFSGSAPASALPPSITSSYYLLGSQFIGTTLSAIVKPVDSLTFTTRYMHQQGDMQVTGSSLTETDSLDSTTNSIGETIDWAPYQQLYVQASANVVFNVISTVYPHAGTATADGTLQNSNNNYWTGMFLVGAVLTRKDDLQLQANYYHAYNSNSNLADLTVPYGVSVRSLTVTVGLKHKISDRCIASGKVGYFDTKNDTTGGFTNYRGPLAYVSLDYSL